MRDNCKETFPGEDDVLERQALTAEERSSKRNPDSGQATKNFKSNNPPLEAFWFQWFSG